MGLGSARGVDRTAAGPAPAVRLRIVCHDPLCGYAARARPSTTPLLTVQIGLGDMRRMGTCSNGLPQPEPEREPSRQPRPTTAHPSRSSDLTSSRRAAVAAGVAHGGSRISQRKDGEAARACSSLPCVRFVTARNGRPLIPPLAQTTNLALLCAVWAWAHDNRLNLRRFGRFEPR